MSTLLKRQNGVFYRISCEAGKRRWSSLRVRDGKVARTLFRQLEAEDGRKRCGLISYFFDEFFSLYSADYRSTTRVMYKACFKNFLRLIGDKPIRWVSVQDGDLFKARRVQEVSRTSVNIELKQLRAFFNGLRVRGYIEKNPFEEVKLLAVDEEEGAYLTEEALSRLLTFVPGKEFREIILFFTYTFLRRGELVNLQWKDIDLSRKELRVVRRTGSTVKGRKTRYVPMHPWVYQYLSTKGIVGEYIFSDGQGGPLKGDSMTDKFKRCVRKAKLDDRLHLHSLRHTGISMAVARGVPLTFVSRIAGHTSTRITDGIYTHIERSNLLSALELLPSFN